MAEKKYADSSKPGRSGHGGGPGARGGYQKPKNAAQTLRRLMGYITRRKWLLVLVAICVIVSAVTGVAGTYLLRPLLNVLVSDMTVTEKITALAKTLAAMAGLSFWEQDAPTPSPPLWPSWHIGACLGCGPSSLISFRIFLCPFSTPIPTGS